MTHAVHAPAHPPKRAKRPASCRTPPTAQFDKIARCVELAREHEAQVPGLRYDMMLRSRPDVLWTGPVLTGGVTLATLAHALEATPEVHRTILTTDDINMFAPRRA